MVNPAIRHRRRAIRSLVTRLKGILSRIILSRVAILRWIILASRVR
jgi:hypothetical protein